MVNRCRDGRKHGARLGSSAFLRVASCLVMAAPLPLVAQGTAQAGAAGWSRGGLTLASEPVLAGSELLVLDVGPQKELQLAAFDPRNGSPVWKLPSAVSGVTAGEAYGPAVIGSTALNMAPAGAATDPAVFLQGVDAATGAVRWTSGNPMIVSDAPSPCPGGGDFCVPVWSNTGTTSSLLVVNPANGHIVTSVAGPNRVIGAPETEAVTAESASFMYQTYASVPTVMQVGPGGHALWHSTVAALFGSSQFNPDYGWDFVVKNGIDIGTISRAPSGNEINLGLDESIAVSARTGRVLWRTGGDYLCGGTLQFLASDVVCKWSGVATEGSSAPFQHLTLDLEGVSEATGAVTWSVPATDPATLALGNDLAFSDSTHVVVRSPGGKDTLLDTANGEQHDAAPGQIFWCQDMPTFKVPAAAGTPGGGQRSAQPVFNGCSASGKTVGGHPSTGWGVVGVEADGLVIWPTPSGLRAVPAD